MNDHFKTLVRRSLKYKKALFLAIGSNIMVALATLVGIPALMPLFNLLFEGSVSDVLPTNVFESQANKIFDVQAWLKHFFNLYFAGIPPQKAILRACMLILTVYFIKNVFQYIVYISNGWLRINVGRDIRDDLFDKTLNLHISDLNKDRKGDLMTRFSSDVKLIEDGFFGVVESIFKSPFIIIGSLFIMFGISVKLTLFVFVLVIFTVVVIGGISRTLRKRSNEAQGQLGNLMSLLEESITGIKTIRAYYAQNHVSSLFRSSNKSYVNKAFDIIRRVHLSSPTSEFLGITVVAVLLWYGSQMVFSGELESSVFFVYIFAFYNIIDPAKKLSGAFYKLQESFGAYDRIDEYLRRPDESQKRSTGNKTLKDLESGIRLQNVNFSYPGSDQQVLTDISMEIPKGSTVALVGQSGSGKTTLADLICRFVYPTEGQVSFDDIDLNELSEESLRDLVALVQQEAILFNDSVRNNVLFGKERSDEELRSALEKASAEDFTKDLEIGLETKAGERGSRFSGGQRQRLSLARAILRDTPILILDEATSALDSQSEKYIQDALAELTKDRTSIIIAHRLTTIQHVDCIFVMEKGRIVEKGNHEELMRNEGVYAQFVELQMLSK